MKVNIINNVFREFDVGVVVAQLVCREYDAELYEDIFPKWASTVVPMG